MNQPWVYMCSASWTPLPPPSPSHPSGSSQCTSPEHPVSHIETGLVICFTCGNMQVRKQQCELDTEQQTGSKSGKEYVKAVYCHPAHLTSMQSTSWETLGWGKHKLESRLPGEISITSDMQMTPHLWQKVKRNWKASWWKWKRRVKSRLKAQHSEN